MFKINGLGFFLVTALSLCVVASATEARSPRKSAKWVGQDFQGFDCYSAGIPFGPYDYLEREKFPGQLFIVEEYHLTPEILNLQKATTTSAINDIQYTLLAWPNHHRALWAAYQHRLLNRGKYPRTIGAAAPVECNLQRAIEFSPRDPIPYMIYGLALHTFERYEEALESFRKANKLMPNDIINLYNMGLTMVALEKYEEARQVAEQVYSTDFPLPGLKNQLIAAGHWGDVPAQPETQEQETPEEEPPEQVSDSGDSAGPADEGVNLTVVSQ